MVIYGAPYWVDVLAGYGVALGAMFTPIGVYEIVRRVRRKSASR